MRDEKWQYVLQTQIIYLSGKWSDFYGEGSVPDSCGCVFKT